jgi:hypothetical protein
LPNNLFLLSRVATKGVDTICSRSRCYLMLHDHILMEGLMDNMLYRLLIRIRPPEVSFYAASLGTSSSHDERQLLQTWHHRLCYINHKAIRKMANSDLVDGLQLIPSTTDDTFCEGCVKGKQHRLSFPVNNPRIRATVPRQLVHTNISGPMFVRSLGGAYY